MRLTWKWQQMRYKPSNRVVAEEEVTRVATPDVKSIDEVATFLTSQKNKQLKPSSTRQMVSLLQPSSWE